MHGQFTDADLPQPSIRADLPAPGVFYIKTFYIKMPMELEDAALSRCGKIGIWWTWHAICAVQPLRFHRDFNYSTFERIYFGNLLLEDTRLMHCKAWWFFRGQQYRLSSDGRPEMGIPIILIYLAMQKYFGQRPFLRGVSGNG